MEARYHPILFIDSYVPAKRLKQDAPSPRDRLQRIFDMVGEAEMTMETAISQSPVKVTVDEAIALKLAERALEGRTDAIALYFKQRTGGAEHIEVSTPQMDAATMDILKSAGIIKDDFEIEM